MALASNERWASGFVVDTDTGAWVTTTNKLNARWWGGFLRDPDGRLVIVYG